ncbi:EamA family transporter, partial [bacterium]
MQPMRSADVVRLMLLGAIWGGSFIFMRIASPVMGAILTAELRVGVAALVLLAIVAGKRVPLHAGRLWRHYLALGALQSAVPFALYCWAETKLDASTAAVLNATTPLFGMVTAALILGDRLSAPKVLGMAIAFAGVAGVVGGGMAGLSIDDLLPVLACLGATLCYGLAATYTKARTTDAAPLANALGSQVASTLMLLPLLPFSWPAQAPTADAWTAVIALGALCTG